MRCSSSIVPSLCPPYWSKETRSKHSLQIGSKGHQESSPNVIPDRRPKSLSLPTLCSAGGEHITDTFRTTLPVAILLLITAAPSIHAYDPVDFLPLAIGNSWTYQHIYYDFYDVDVDRYTIDGRLRQVMLSTREMDVDELAE